MIYLRLLVKLNRQREFEPKYCHFELWLTIQYYIEFDTDKCPESVLNYFNVFIQVESGLNVCLNTLKIQTLKKVCAILAL